MRGFVVYLLLGLLAVLLQSSLLPLLLPASLRPNLLLILVLFLGLNESMGRALLVTLLLGGLQDCFTGTTLGLYMSVNLAILLLVRLLSEKLNSESPLLLLLLVAAGTIIQNLLIGFCLTTFADAGAGMSLLLSVLPLQLVGNLLAAVLLFYLFLSLQPLLGTRSGLAGLIYQSKRHGT